MRLFRHILTTSFVFVGLALQATLPVWADVNVTATQIEQQVRAYLQKSTPLESKDCTLFIEPLKLPTGDITLKGDHVDFFFTDSRVTPLAFRTIVHITMSTEAETREIGIPVRMQIEKPVWVTTTFVKSHQPITATMVKQQRKRLDYDSEYAIDVTDDVTRYSSRTNLAPGMVLDDRRLEKTNVVKANEDVHLIMKVGNGVQLTVDAKALENGALGDKIHVSQRTHDHKLKIYTATVVNKDTVMVQR